MSDLETTLGSGRWAREPLALFAEDFDRPRQVAAIPGPEVIPPGFSAADIAAARAEAWAEGFEAGTTETRSGVTAEIGDLLTRVAATLRDTRDDAVAIAEQAADLIARTLMDSLAVVLPALCARHGDAELQALVRRLLPALAREPSVTMRVNPAHVPGLMRELDRLDPDLMERVTLLPVATIPLGDVRMSWQDGVATRDAAELWREVQAVLEPAGLLTPVAAVVLDKELQHAG